VSELDVRARTMRPSRDMRSAVFALLIMASPSIAWATDKLECIKASDEAQAARLDGHLQQARARLLVCADESCPRLVRSSCADWLNGVDKELPSVVLSLREANGRDAIGGQVTIDGVTTSHALEGRAVPLDPGTHTLHVSLPDGRVQDEVVVVRIGEQQRHIDITLPATGDKKVTPTKGEEHTSPTPNSTPWAAWATTIVAGAAWVSFGGFALAGHLQYQDLKDSCAPNCDPSRGNSIDRLFWVADVSLGVAVVATAVATVLFLVHPTSRARTAVAPSLLAF
jgi:hypothetical protein